MYNSIVEIFDVSRLYSAATISTATKLDIITQLIGTQHRTILYDHELFSALSDYIDLATETHFCISGNRYQIPKASWNLRMLRPEYDTQVVQKVYQYRSLALDLILLQAKEITDNRNIDESEEQLLRQLDSVYYQFTDLELKLAKQVDTELHKMVADSIVQSIEATTKQQRQEEWNLIYEQASKLLSNKKQKGLTPRTEL